MFQERRASYFEPSSQFFSKKNAFRQDVALALSRFAEKPRQRVKDFFSQEARQRISSAHQNWDNTSFIKSLSREASHQYGVEDLMDQFGPNWSTFTDEYVLGRPKKTYRYTLLHNDQNKAIGTNGIDNAYKEVLYVQAKRFEQKLSVLGKHKQRGEVETYNSLRLDTWAANALNDRSVPLGAKLAWFSPSGHVVEGYPGISAQNHSFIWIYEKKEDEHGIYIEMTQYRCWPTLQQIDDIQRQFLTQGRLLDTQLPAGLTQRNAAIAKMIELPASTSIDEIETTIYATEKKWKKKRKDMPEQRLSAELLERFEEERTRVLEEYLKIIYRTLLSSTDIYEKLERPYSDPWWTSKEYKRLIGSLDAAFAFAKQGIEGWVERRLKGKKELQQVPIEDLFRFFHTYIAQKDGTATFEELDHFNRAARTVLSSGGKLLGAGQCGIGTVIPLNLARSMFDSFGFNVFSQPVRNIQARHLSKLTAGEKRKFRQQVLGKYRSLQFLDNNSQPRKFWVLKKYYADYDGNCYQDRYGVLRGPCGVELDMEKDELILTDEKYQELLAETYRAEKSQQDAIKKLNAQRAQALASAKTPDDKKRVNQDFDDRLRVLMRNLGDGILSIAMLGMPSVANAQAAV